MKHITKIELKCDKKDADNIIKSIHPEIESQKNKRSVTEVKKTEKGLVVKISSDDISALRAAFNSITKLMAVYLEMKNVK